MHLEKYEKKLDYSYTFGSYPTIELLKAKPDKVLQVILHSKFISEEGLKLIDNYTKENNISVETNDKLIKSLSAKENCYVIGVFKKYEQLLERTSNHVVLVTPRDPGNLGTIIRNMLAFDFHDLAIIGHSVDKFSPDTIRASMGAVFSVNIQRFENIEEYMNTYTKRSYFPFMTDGSIKLQDAKFSKPFSLIFGNESSGLPKEFKEYGQSVHISQSKEVDSLNLAISTGIALHYLYTK